MAPNPHQIRFELAIAAAKMQAFSGQEWNAFCKALGQHAELAMMQVLTADPGSVLNVQGRAAALNDLCNTLFNAKAVAAEAERLMTPVPKPAP